MCRNRRKDKPRAKSQPTHMVEGVPPSGEYMMYSVVNQKAPSTPLKTTVALERKELHMVVDTGSSLSLISETTFKALRDADTTFPLQQTEVKLWTYTRQEICVLGFIMVTA